jgi:hypothetical protein
MEPVEIDIRLKQNVAAEGKKAVAAVDELAAASNNAQSDVKKMAKEQADVVKQIEKDIKSIEGKLSKAAPGNAKMQLTQELAAAKRALDEEKAALDQVNASIEKTAEKHQRLRTQIMNAKDALAQMEMQGKRNTPEYRAMAEELGVLADQMGDTNAQVRILADDEKGFKAVASGVNGMAGAMSAATGVAALFGAENEDLEKIQTRLQAVMAISIGMQQVAETLNKDSYFSVHLLAKAKTVWAGANLKVATTLGISTAAAKVFMVTITGGLILAVTAAIALFSHFSDKQKKATEESKKFSESAASSVAEPLSAYKRLQEQWNALTDDMSEKKKFVDDNKKAFEDLGVEVNNVSDAENLLVANEAAFVASIIAKAKAAASMEIAAEKYKEAMTKMLEAEKMSDTVTVTTSQGGQSITGGGGFKNTTVKNRVKQDALKQSADMLAEADSFVKQATILDADAQAALDASKIKTINKTKETAAKQIKETYNAEAAITEMILDIRAKRVKLELDQQKDSLQKRLEGIRLEKDEQIRGIEDKEKSIVDAYNKNKKGEKGFVAASSLAQIDPKLAEQLAAEKTRINKAYAQNEVVETEKYQQEISDLIFQYADERTQIAYNYNKEIAKARELGLNDWADAIEKEKQQRIDGITLGLIEETELYKSASDEKLELSRQTTQLLIDDLQKRIDAEIAAGRLSKEQGEKWLNDLKSAQQKTGEARNANNPFAQLGGAIRKNNSAKEALKNFDPTGMSPAEASVALDDLKSKAATAGKEMAAAAGSALMGVQAILGSVVDGLDKLGMLTEEEKKDADNIMGMIGGAANIAMGIAKGNPVAIIQGSVDLLVNAFVLFDKKSKDIEKAQKAAKKNLDDLTRAYDRLQRAVDKALGTDVYTRQKEQINNLKRQINENNALIALELQKKKKKQDQAAIQQWRDEINALNDQIEDVTQSIAEDLAQTSAKDLAQQVGDALAQAAADGTDAFTAMGDVINNVLKNAVTNALQKQFLEKQMQAATEYLSSAMADGKLSDAERKQFAEMVTAAGNNYNEALEAYKDILGSSDSAREGAKKGIATASQDSIDELTGGVYALRIGVADIRNIAREELLIFKTILNQMEALIENTQPISEMAENIARLTQDISEIKTRGLNIKV